MRHTQAKQQDCVYSIPFVVAALSLAVQLHLIIGYFTDIMSTYINAIENAKSKNTYRPVSAGRNVTFDLL